MCEDCFFLISLSQKYINKAFGIPYPLYFATDYQQRVVKEMLFNFKYKNLSSLDTYLALLLALYITSISPTPRFITLPQNYFIVPIPSHPRKERKRGFNPPTKIAQKLSGFLGISTIPLLEKHKQTRPQVELSKKERENNIKGAFRVNKYLLKSIEGRKALILDDVYTTGSTLKEAIRVLEKESIEIEGLLVVAKD